MTRLSVPHMSCGHCKATVEAALRSIPNTGAIVVDLTLRQIEVTGDAPASALIAALDQAGYPAKIQA